MDISLITESSHSSEKIKIPPIIKELSGLDKFETQKTDKELLLTALEKKYLQEKK